MNKSILLYVFLLLLQSIAACKKHQPDTSEPCNPNYVKDIKPIISGKCALSGCHGVGSTIADFTKDSIVKNRADIGRIRSYIFELKIMPPASAQPLTEQEKETLKCWLDNGAPQG